jgi:hypothetical protein
MVLSCGGGTKPLLARRYKQVTTEFPNRPKNLWNFTKPTLQTMSFAVTVRWQTQQELINP